MTNDRFDPLAQVSLDDDMLLGDILGSGEVRPAEKPIGVSARSFVRSAAKRSFQNLLMVKAAAAQIGRLPDPGETIHLVVAGDFRTWDLVPAMLSLKRPATIAELYLATLSYNRDNLVELVALIDAGQVAAVTMITSVYDRANDPDRFNHALAELSSRGQRLLAMRNHCKLILARFDSGEHYVSESSANLRSHSTTEQIALTHDADLFAFHRGWMEEVIAA